MIFTLISKKENHFQNINCFHAKIFIPPRGYSFCHTFCFPPANSTLAFKTEEKAKELFLPALQKDAPKFIPPKLLLHNVILYNSPAKNPPAKTQSCHIITLCKVAAPVATVSASLEPSANRYQISIPSIAPPPFTR